eukprot:CAMPEP_0167740340 /NCGR_PEP_ID=MMETSP0110_2-20121227/219_1 /TAXON_ID=629695 /ORGANISM="Gymnochlora sp., Strain CCMP2014" /LENGTH=436 /DNA_ID=CAMNT_0007624215 /DNA_START=147 /DNA_END=1457 /DNA_ORIENTATION=-
MKKSNQISVDEVRAGLVVKYINARIMRGGTISKLNEEYLWTRGGKIIDPMARFWQAAKLRQYAAEVVVDCKGLILVPGYIDLQLNGAFGIDFTSLAQTADGEESKAQSDIKYVAKRVLEHGVTSFSPTIITSSAKSYEKLSKILVRTPGGREHCNILGAHLEGPFISELKYGCHPASLVRKPYRGYASIQSVYGEKLLSETDIITLAPEISGALSVVQPLSEKGILVSCGHSMAKLNLAEKALHSGARMVTHLFNAMPTFHHRDPGLVGLLGSTKDKPYYGIISDGIHAHPNSVRIAFKAHPEGAVLVTDAMSAMGLGEGNFQLGETTVTIKDDRATTNNGKTLAGSIARMDLCVRNFREFTGCSTVQAIEAATLRPAEALGISNQKGTLNIGSDADMLLVDDQLNVCATIVGGEFAWRLHGLNLVCKLQHNSDKD